MKKLFVFVFLLITFLSFVPSTAPVHAQAAWDTRLDASRNTVCVGQDYKRAPVGNNATPANDVATIAGLECIVANVLATVITMIGIAAFVMFLIGGFRYLTAGSNTKGVEAGKNAITFAILGIVVALASFLIVRTISVITGVSTIMTFTIQH